jgi:pimeloyl-ACP methyl ester carboxylesterase
MSVGWFLPFRLAVIVPVMLAAALPVSARASDTAVVPSENPSNIVVGFVGGFVDHNNPHHGPVQLAQHFRQTLPKGTYVRVFENRHRRVAYKAVMQLLDVNHDGVLSPEERDRARIVIFGHSWGGAAAVLLARDLRRQSVPVLLTVQVDSVAKLWQNDSVIPDNVAEAVNFYQTEGIIHGRRQIAAADPAKTEILGNYLLDYKKHPIACPQASLWDRILTPGHMQSECDPQVLSQIESMVEQRFSPQSGGAAVSQAQGPKPIH